MLGDCIFNIIKCHLLIVKTITVFILLAVS
jgi:hypothetical protein